MNIKTIILTTATVLSVNIQAQSLRHTDIPATDTLMVHDPVMAFDGKRYHVFSTGHGIQHAISNNRKSWTLAGPVMSVIPQWTHDSVPGFKKHVWAPDIIRHRGKWWMAYSCSTFGKNTSAIGLMSADRLEPGTIWNDHGAIVCSKGKRDNWNAIDPNFVIDGNGEAWLAYGSFWDGIQIVRLDTSMHIAKGEKPHTIARRKTDGNANPVEAPFIFKHDGYYYLFVSWDYCCRGMESTYKVAVGRSRHVAGPYTGPDGKDMNEGGGLVIFEGDKKKLEAAGHCAVYRFDNEDIFICHGYSIARNGASILIEKTITWDDKGWPVLK
ncbi:family 43 glycosylhydrolase [Xylanibacter muris]|uniref:Family 43 glycosylhydrolase n=1 Tax=Xylanibacter muris TaxID=2736290 RepID=A0ABX2AKS1_9BACT|nr:family 43 glycosylhydrolase [Xylanibacter muris]NPD91803.1 family 43 glycosylhydrolase [Xylanibacter muris]